MGCWNETCALTRLPIQSGAPVVILHTVHGPRYQTRGAETTELLFGLPESGKYDDYGGIEDVDNEALRELNRIAFGRAGYYREWITQSKGLSARAESHWVASHQDTLWGMVEDVKPAFYAELGIAPADLSMESTTDSARAKLHRAFVMSRDALARLGVRLKSLDIPQHTDEAMNAIFGVVAEVFGPERAWHVYSVLRGNGLFARRGMLFMHRQAYDSVVQEFGSRKVRVGKGPRQTVRAVLEGMLETLISRHPQVLSEAREVFGDSVDTPLLKLLRYCEPPRYALLTPMSSMWMMPRYPLIAHFWAGADMEAIVGATSRKELADFMVFQWARAYLRIELKRPSGGSQNNESVLAYKALADTVKAMRARGEFERDFEGYLL